MIIALTIFILTCVSSAYAEDNQTAPQVQEKLNNGNSPQITNSSLSSNTVISGTVNNCKTKNPFPGVNVTVTNNGEFIASSVTQEIKPEKE